MKKLVKICSLFLIILMLFSAFLPGICHASNVVTETYNNMPESQLGLSNILSIILISVGVVLILLGVAIFIRLKNM